MGKNENCGNRLVKATVRYQKQDFRPQDFLRFIQLGSFQEDWERLGFDDEDQMALEVLVMSGPTEAPPVDGTGGFRLVKFSSGRTVDVRPNGVLVGYAYFPKSSVATLLVAADLNEPLGLTPDWCKKLKDIIAEIEIRLELGD